MYNGTIFKPNDRNPLTKEEFRLYYTSASSDQQTIDVYVEDNFGQTAKLSFEFNSQKDKQGNVLEGQGRAVHRARSAQLLAARHVRQIEARSGCKHADLAGPL